MVVEEVVEGDAEGGWVKIGPSMKRDGRVREGEAGGEKDDGIGGGARVGHGGEEGIGAE